jgi:hypothetical protein
MILKSSELTVDKACEKALRKCLAESGMPGIYFTLDEIAPLTTPPLPHIPCRVHGQEGCIKTLFKHPDRQRWKTAVLKRSI